MALLAFCGTHPLNVRNLITDIQANLIPAGRLGTSNVNFAMPLIDSVVTIDKQVMFILVS